MLLDNVLIIGVHMKSLLEFAIACAESPKPTYKEQCLENAAKIIEGTWRGIVAGDIPATQEEYDNAKYQLEYRGLL